MVKLGFLSTSRLNRIFVALIAPFRTILVLNSFPFIILKFAIGLVPPTVPLIVAAVPALSPL